MEIKELMELLLDLPVKIQEKEILLLDTIDELDNTLLQIKIFENNILNEVSEILLPDGKRKYSNELKRELECQRRLAENSEFSVLQAKAKDGRRRVEMDKIMINYLKRRLQSLQMFASLKWGGENK